MEAKESSTTDRKPTSGMGPKVVTAYIGNVVSRACFISHIIIILG